MTFQTRIDRAIGDKPFVLATDLDGTFLGGTAEGRETLYNLIEDNRDTVGLISASFGKWDGVKGGDHAEVSDPENFRYMRLEFDGDKIVGALSLGRTDHIGVLRGLIQTEVELGEWKAKLMSDPHLIADAYVACSQ